jgi:hypothetical protein
MHGVFEVKGQGLQVVAEADVMLEDATQTWRWVLVGARRCCDKACCGQCMGRGGYKMGVAVKHKLRWAAGAGRTHCAQLCIAIDAPCCATHT